MYVYNYNRKRYTRCAPTSHKWGEITPISRVISPQLSNYKAIYRAY